MGRVLLAVIVLSVTAGCDDGGDDGGSGGGFVPIGQPDPVGGGGGAAPEPVGCAVEVVEDPFEIIDDCPGDAVCLRPEGADVGECVSALPRRWRFLGIAAVMPDRKSNGDCWDLGCGAPDPIISLFHNGDFVASWGPHQDLFEVSAQSAVEADLGEVSLIAGDELIVTVHDSDVSEDDPGLECTLRAEARALKQRIALCEVEGFAVMFGFAPDR